MKIRYLLILLILAISKPASPVLAQYIRKLDSHQFLGATNVFHIVRDRSGFLWFCTDHGLIRFDGQRLHYFTKKDGLADNLVFNIYEDSQGRIWPSCYNGNYCYIMGNRVYNEANDPVLAALPHAGSYIVYMAEDTGKGLYVGFLSGKIMYLSNGTGTWIPSTVSKYSGLVPYADKILYSKSRTAEITTFSGHLRLVADSAGAKIYNGDRLTWHLDHPALSDQTVTDLYLNQQHLLIASTTHGLEFIDVATRKHTTLLQGIRVSSCTEDLSGNLWVSTINEGIFVLHPELDRIQPLTEADGREIIEVNDNRLVFIRNKNIYELIADRDGIKAVLAGTGIFSYDNPLLITDQLVGWYDTWKKCTFIKARHGRSLTGDLPFMKAIFTDQRGHLFGYGLNNAYYFQVTNSGVQLLHQSTLSEKIKSCRSNPVTHEVYFICGDGLYKCNFKQPGNELILHSPLLARVNVLYLTNTAILLPLADMKGYYSFPMNGEKHLTFHPTGFNPLNLQNVRKNELLATTESGDYILPVPPAIPQPVTYPFTSGEYDRLLVLKDYCLAQIEGKYYYFKDSLLGTRTIPRRIYLNQVTVDGKQYASDSVVVRNNLNPDIRISVTAVDFSRTPCKIMYRIKGPALNDDWITTEGSELTFALQAPGTYVVDIAPSGLNNDRRFTISRTIIVHRPFVRSPAFLIICGIGCLLIFCGAFWGINRYRYKQFYHELNYLKLEHRAINALLNPHFVFNSINNIQGLINRAERGNAAEYLAALSRLIRQNLENLEYNLIPLQDELDMTDRYIHLQNLRFGGRIHLNISEKEVDATTVNIPPLLIHTFVENSIVHGIRDKEQHLEINITIRQLKENYLQIEITDNGVGYRPAVISPNKLKTSMGISFNRKRLARLSAFYRLNQSIEIVNLSNQGASGTRVTIVLYAGLKELFEPPVHAAH